jgi:hypothetical protein
MRPGEIRDPGAGGLHSLRIHPGRRYRLPRCAFEALVTAVGRDLLLQLAGGGMVLLRDLISVEVMADPPVFEVGEHDLPAGLVAVLGLAGGGATPLCGLFSGSARQLLRAGVDLSGVLAALQRDGLLPVETAPEWRLL